ncbi:RHS repeat-associated core domain-containing protein [Sorangium sp. So ce834]|uniref:RHS repeat-associated core domain-containing protein n=1 Tax=Sorangium sp. So ce834 TaxID=3133321 RepID=UPI003F61218A
MTLVTEADGSASKSAYAYYEPFGRRIERDGAPLGGLLAELRLGLTGHEHDDELGLINLKGRIYDPKLKRVLTPDPVVSAPLFGQSYNRYSYVLNDPMNLVDPTGYEPTGPDCTTCAPWTPPGDGGGGVTIISGGSGDGGDGNPYSRDGSADDRDDLVLQPHVAESPRISMSGRAIGTLGSSAHWWSPARSVLTDVRL